MYICMTAGNVLFCRPKENQKGRRCPEGMKAPVGLLSRRPVCEANAACSARQGHGDFDAFAARRGLFSFDGKREPENHQRFRRAGPTNHGLLALDNPKEERLHTKNPNRFARGFFVFRRFQVACATSRTGKLVLFLPRGSRRLTAEKCCLPQRPHP